MFINTRRNCTEFNIVDDAIKSLHYSPWSSRSVDF